MSCWWREMFLTKRLNLFLRNFLKSWFIVRYFPYLFSRQNFLQLPLGGPSVSVVLSLGLPVGPLFPGSWTGQLFQLLLCYENERETQVKTRHVSERLPGMSPTKKMLNTMSQNTGMWYTYYSLYNVQIKQQVPFNLCNCMYSKI